MFGCLCVVRECLFLLQCAGSSAVQPALNGIQERDAQICVAPILEEVEGKVARDSLWVSCITKWLIFLARR